MIRCERSDMGLACLKALAEGNCQVRCLDLDFLASTASNRLLQRVLQNRGIQELRITLGGFLKSSNLVPALEAIDNLERIDTLGVRIRGGKCLDFVFEKICMTKLKIPDHYDVVMVRDLLDLGRNTLREVHFPEHDRRFARFKEELEHCREITHLTLYSCDGLADVVPLLPNLKSITIKDINASLTNWLKWAQKQYSGKIHIDVKIYGERSLQELVDLADNLRKFRVSGYGGFVRITARAPSHQLF
ncbi:uncharacterized protein LOC117642641 [Thrips palmi]|uniref:Uncharacterized protein LOC117642641 n=1 Tax=Thrips palmi TaxID=161013 RepID=A0A6P8YBE2_THRPL|nr:uncharacterized protein LOC117642641 [Thrips palmi]